MTSWEGLPPDYQVILQALPDLRSTTFEWVVRPGLPRERTLEIEDFIHARIQEWREGTALERQPWMWDNFAARYQLIGREIKIGGD